MSDGRPRSRIAAWVPVMIGFVWGFGVGLSTCGDYDWHAPPPVILGPLVLGTVTIGAIATYGRAELSWRPGLAQPVMRAPAISRLAFYVTMGIIACLASLATVGFALAIQDVSRVLASIIASVWLGAVPVLQTVAQWAIEPKMSLGADAMRVRGRLIPLRSIRSVSRARRVLSIKLADDDKISVPFTEEPMAAAMEARLRARLAEDAVVPVSLDRAGRSIEAWKKDLTKADHGYRDGQVTPEHAEEVLASVAASGEERVGAALVLAGAGRADRVRIAANSCVDARVRVALLRAADGSLRDREMEEIEPAHAPNATRVAR